MCPVAHLIIPPGFANLTWKFIDAAGGFASFSVAYVVSPPIVTDDLNTAFTATEGALTDVLSTSSQFLGIHALIGNDGPKLVADSDEPPASGGRGQDMCPPNVSHLIKKKTEFAGRRFRGRIYVPDVAEGHVTDQGTLDSTELSLLAEVANQLFTGNWGSIGDPVVLHTHPANDPTPLVDMLAETFVGTQRRRLHRNSL